MYARTNDKGAVPLGWEETEYLWKKFTLLGGIYSGYELIWERKMFSHLPGAEIRCVLRRWNRQGGQALGNEPVTPTTLLETDDPKHMTSVLLMLVSNVESEGWDRNNVIWKNPQI